MKPQEMKASLVVQLVNNLCGMWETRIQSLVQGEESGRSFGVHGLGVDAVVLQTSCALSLSLISSCMRRADRAFPGICSSARQCRCSAATQRAHRLLEPRPPRASSSIMRISAGEILTPTHTASFMKFSHSFHPHDSRIRK